MFILRKQWVELKVPRVVLRIFEADNSVKVTIALAGNVLELVTLT